MKVSKKNMTTVKTTDYLDGFQYLTTTTSSPGGGGGSESMMGSARAFERQAYSIDNGSSTSLNPATLKDPDLQFFPTAEGFYDYKKDQYIYQYKDHLGNTRISFARNSAGALEIVDVNDYYPFGMSHLKSGTAMFGQGSYKNYKYNGKELQETGMYDYGARMYMADIGRWGIIDPLAENSRKWNPYNYAYNNPIRYLDPDGRQGTDWVHNRSTNSVYWNSNATSQATAGANETYLGTSGTYTTENGSTTALNSDGSHTNNSLMGGLGVMNNLDPLIQAGNSAPVLSMATFGTAGDGSYIRETPSLNTAEGAFANPSAQLASTTLTAMQQAPLAIASELAIVKIGGLLSKSTTIYRSVSPAELADIGANGLRVGESGYATEKLFTTTASDASFFSKTFYPWDKTANTIIKAKVPNSVMKTSGSYIMDGKNVISIPANQLQNIKNVKALNYSPLP